MWYITTNIDLHTAGGLGHSFYDIISSYIIAEIYDITVVYKPLPTFSDAHLRKKYAKQIKKSKNLIGPGTLNNVIDTKWDDIFGLNKEIHIDSLKCEKVFIKLEKNFISLSKEKLDSFFSKFDRNKDILFILDKNNRIYLHEFNRWDSSLYQNLRKKMKEKCSLNNSYVDKNLVVHIRGGDTFNEPLNIIQQKLKNILIYISPTYITIISYGSESQCKQIKDTFKDIEDNNYNIKYELNTDTFKCFEIMTSAYILLCGKSSYPKVAAYYSDAIVIYKKQNYGSPYPEIYTDRYIFCDDEGNFDEEKFKSFI
jgi:hypothetical protein